VSTSQNGWQINPPLTNLTVDGVSFGGAHGGDAHTVLEYVATRFHHEVESLRAGQCGCYNPRKIPGTDTWSNHASATAIDINWTRHPLGARGTFTTAQVAAIRRILAACDGVIRWGGDYTHTVDEMHFEIVTGMSAVTTLAKRIEDDMAPTAEQIVAAWQKAKIGDQAYPNRTNGDVMRDLAKLRDYLIADEAGTKNAAIKAAAPVRQLPTIEDIISGIDDIRTTLAGGVQP
jgi:D-alanyl-D-alanine carboxypeptidase